MENLGYLYKFKYSIDASGIAHHDGIVTSAEGIIPFNKFNSINFMHHLSLQWKRMIPILKLSVEATSLLSQRICQDALIQF